MTEEKHRKKPFLLRAKYSLIISGVFFGLNGIIFPSMLDAPLTIMSFVASGAVSVILLWISMIIGKFILEI